MCVVLFYGAFKTAVNFYLIALCLHELMDYATPNGVEPVKVEGELVEDLPRPGRSDLKVSHCVVGGAHAFILRISSFVGLAPLRFEAYQNLGFKVAMSSAMCIYSYVFVTFLVICAILGLIAEMNVERERSVRMPTRISQFVSACDVLVVVVTASAGVYGAPRRMREMLGFMGSVASVDKSISGKYSVLLEKKLCLLLGAVLLFFTTLIVCDFTFYMLQAQKLNRLWSVFTNYICFYILWFVVMVLQLQFAFTALSLRKRFGAVNEVLELTADNISAPLCKKNNSTSLNMFAIRLTSSDIQRPKNVTLLMDSISEQMIVMRKNGRGPLQLIVSPHDAIRRLASLHGTLCEVISRIDDSYGLPLIVIIVSTLLHLIVTPYFLIIEIMVSVQRVYFIILQFLWCVTHMLRLFILVEPCHYTIVENKKTEDLVCRLMTSAPSTGVLSSRLELFSRQLMMRSISYSPLGMCMLDRPLISSMIGAITTYLVILIQFQRYDSSP